MMWKSIALATLFSVATPTTAQSIAPGRWDVTSTAVDIDIPGAPGFLLRMMKGKSRTERKCVAPDLARAGVSALLAPDPKARCHVDSVRLEGGRYAQLLSCPQKSGTPLRISRSGTYDAAGFSGRLELAGTTPKGTMRITLYQQAVHSAKQCKG